MLEDPFVQQHGWNAPCNMPRPARTSRTAVRQQIKRSREVLTDLIEREGLNLDAKEIIRSVESSTRTVRYQINAKVSWKHWTGSDSEDSGVCILLPGARPPQP